MDELLPCVYSELRQLAAAQLRHEKPGHSLQATALVHEAYLRLVVGSNSQNLTNRRYFFGAAAQAMSRILVEQARRKARVKHGGELERVDLPEISAAPSDHELILLDDALSRLQNEDPIAAEIVQLKFFAGVGRDAIAEMLGPLYWDRGQLDEAIEEFAKQVELEPKDAEMRRKLADCLRYRGRFTDAVAEYRQVIELDPTYTSARVTAGYALMGASDLDGALEITPPNTTYYRELTALASLRPKLDELASGTTTVVSTFEEARKLTELAVTDKRYALGAKAYQIALEANDTDPHLIKTHYGCYHAQCAVLAGTGADPTYPSAEKQARLRLLGLQWLTNERDAWKADLAKTPKERSDARRALQYWFYDPRLAAVREQEALGALPEAERSLWLAFWEDVRQTLKNSE